jgi:hypothetical protein
MNCKFKLGTGKKNDLTTYEQNAASSQIHQIPIYLSFFVSYLAIVRCVYGPIRQWSVASFAALMCICSFVNVKTARPNIAVGGTTESKNYNFNLRETCLLKMLYRYLWNLAHAACSRWSNSTFVRKTKSPVIFSHIFMIYACVHHAKSPSSHLPLLQNAVPPNRHWKFKFLRRSAQDQWMQVKETIVPTCPQVPP